METTVLTFNMPPSASGRSVPSTAIAVANTTVNPAVLVPASSNSVLKHSMPCCVGSTSVITVAPTSLRNSHNSLSATAHPSLGSGVSSGLPHGATTADHRSA